MTQVFKKVRGTTSNEFYVGNGDIDTAGDPTAGIRTTVSGTFQYKNSGGVWQEPGGGSSLIENYGILTTAGGLVVTPTTGNKVALVIQE